MTTWTKEQLKAIKKEGESIIVSAGAGSGKTAVLTERVIEKLESGTSIDELLILTFTKLAANEMKNRIKDEIKKRIELSDEMRKIDSSYITTFDSFALSLVKKYHYLLNVKKDLDIIDSSILNIKVREYLEDIMELEYQQKNCDFVKLINDFCIKDDQEIKNLILLINDKLNLKYNKKEYLDNYINNYYSDSFIKENIDDYLDLLKNEIDIINNNLTKISNEIDIDYYNQLSNVIFPIIHSNNYLEIKNSVNAFDKLPNIPKGSSDLAKALKEKISESIKKLKELTRFKDDDALLDTIKLTMPYIKAIIRIINNLDNLINKYKNENDLYDFIDICKMAIKLVKENVNIKDEITKSFKEIMVDEYQDTSDLQEMFVNLISNNNVYMVGDVKQSIYRFRNANPDIFRHKYNLYSKNIGGYKIDLVNNFRSRKEVIENINLIFNNIMNEFIGGANYRKDHQMVFGNLSYVNEGKLINDSNLEIYNYDYEKEMYFSKEEIEAFIIAKNIRDKISNHYQVFDTKTKQLREAKYSDFAILIDRSSSFPIFKKVFQYNKIPLSIYQDEYLTNSSLFMIIRNIFKLINLVYDNDYNKEFEYAFLSVGRSFLCDYDDNELFDIIVNKNYQNTIIMEKIKKIVLNISSKTLSVLLDEVISEFDIFNRLRKVSDIVNNYTKLDYLYSLASNLNKMGYGFKDFDIYMENLFNSKQDIRFSVNKDDEASVKIMTIHASKGLEYPICYYPGLYKTFNIDDVKSKIIFSNELGFITPYYDEGVDDTFYRELFKNKYYQDEVGEKLRLFYVALTRAREKMIFIMPSSVMDESYENDLVSDDIRLHYRSFTDIINSIKSKLEKYIINVDLKSLNLVKEYNLINNLDNLNSYNNEKIDIIDYPKYQIIQKEINHFSKNSLKIFTKEEISNMTFGTKMHYYLETLNLKNPCLSDVDSVFKEKIEKFLTSDLLKNIQNAKVYQEYEFIDQSNASEKHGIIDLMVEYSNYIDIIDYKLKNVLDDAYLKQLNGYRDYISKVTGKNVNIYLYSIIDSEYKKL